MINESAPFSEDFAPTASGWRSAKVGHQLSSEVLHNVQAKYQHLDKATRNGVLFAMLHIRKGDIMRMKDSINKIFMLAEQEKPNDWIATVAKILKDALSARKLNVEVDTWSPAFSDALNKVGKEVKEHGIDFHPTEFALTRPEARPSFPYASASYKSKEPTIQHHYKLNSTAMDASLAHRRKVFADILKSQVSTSPTSSSTDRPFSVEKTRTSPTLPTAAFTATNAAHTRPHMRPTSSSSIFVNGRPGASGIGARTPVVPSAVAAATAAASTITGSAPGTASLFNMTTSRYTQQQSQQPQRVVAPPPPLVPAGASSLFIRSGRKNSLSRPPLQRASISADDNGAPAPASAATPKGFKRPQRTQMLDFTEQSTLEKNTMKNIDAAHQKIQAEKEARKERLQEQRRLLAEKRRLELEERKRTRERKQAAAAAAAAAAALPPSPDLDSAVKRRRVHAEGTADHA